jgi:hypothetical protein
MDNPIVIIIIICVLLIGMVILFFVADFLSKNNVAKKGSTGSTKSSKSVAEKEVASEKDMSKEVLPVQDDHNLADEIEALIVDSSSKREDTVETASQRSRMHNRRARMLEYYDKKYKSRTVIFDQDSFDEPVSATSQAPAFVIDGIEITKEDVKKLTALNDVLARKKSDS